MATFTAGDALQLASATTQENRSYATIAFMMIKQPGWRATEIKQISSDDTHKREVKANTGVIIKTQINVDGVAVEHTMLLTAQASTPTKAKAEVRKATKENALLLEEKGLIITDNMRPTTNS